VNQQLSRPKRSGKAPRWFFRSRVLFCLTVAWVQLLGAQARQLALNEDQVKAAFVYNFVKFVEWPDETQSVAGPFVIGVLGDTALTAHIADTVRGKAVRGRGFEVRHFTAPDDLIVCHVLFVVSPDQETVQRTLHVARNFPALTIGELRGFSEWGGVIELIVEDNKFRFEINAGAARQGGLKVSSRLLRLARSVRGN
jgi:hypothetical protein